jgi:pre-mRNA-processing factor 17
MAAKSAVHLLAAAYGSGSSSGSSSGDDDDGHDTLRTTTTTATATARKRDHGGDHGVGSDTDKDDDVDTDTESTDHHHHHHRQRRRGQRGDRTAKTTDKDDDDDDDDDEEEAIFMPRGSREATLAAVVSAPRVDPRVGIDAMAAGTVVAVDPRSRELPINVRADVLYAPSVGPVNPFTTQQQRAQRNTLAGYVESAGLDDLHFENQRRTFDMLGYAVDPATHGVVGNVELASRHGNASLLEMGSSGSARKEYLEHMKSLEKASREAERQRLVAAGMPAPPDLDAMTPEEAEAELDRQRKEYAVKKLQWQVTHSKRIKRRLAQANPDVAEDAALLGIAAAAGISVAAVAARAGAAGAGAAAAAEEEAMPPTIDESTILHLAEDEIFDYQGRSFMHIPHNAGVNLESDAPPERCYLPKKQLHQWMAHKDGVGAIRWFPKSAHLLLSGGMDNTVKVRVCVRVCVCLCVSV